MFTTSHKFLVIFLAVLQLFAPLVHAHTGEKISDVGLHVPGLESYAVEHEPSLSQAVSNDFSSGRIGSHPIATLLTSMDGGNAVDRLELSRPPSLTVEGIIVGVGAGMKDKPVNAVSDLDNSLYLHQQAAFNAAISPFDITTPSQGRLFVSCLFIPSLSPRAPPAQ